MPMAMVNHHILLYYRLCQNYHVSSLLCYQLLKQRPHLLHSFLVDSDLFEAGVNFNIKHLFEGHTQGHKGLEKRGRNTLLCHFINQ